jgi:hypothetical protein
MAKPGDDDEEEEQQKYVPNHAVGVFVWVIFRAVVTSKTNSISNQGPRKDRMTTAELTCHMQRPCYSKRIYKRESLPHQHV